MLMKTANLSLTALARVKTFFRGQDVPVTMASLAKIREAIHAMSIPVVVREVELGTGAEEEGKTVLCLLSAFDVYLTVCRDLDRAVERGWFRANVLNVYNNTITFIFMMDGGGGVEKVVLRLLNVSESCSARHCSIIASGEAKDPQCPKPGETYPNVEKILEPLDYRFDLSDNTIVEVGGKHCLIPARACPLVWQWVTVDTDAVFVSCSQTQSLKSPADRLLERQAVVDRSAVLVLCGGVCLGVSCQLPDGTFVSFPFRERPPVTVDVTPVVGVLRVQVMLASDLMATSLLLGMPNQSNCACILCRCSAKGFKETARRPDFPDVDRTADSQFADLTKFNAQKEPKQTPKQKKKKKNPVNAVSEKPLFNIDWSMVIPGFLHLILGLGNDQITDTRERLAVIDNISVLRMRERDALCGLVDSAECELALALTEARRRLGDGNDILNERVPVGVDPGHVLDTISLDDWAPVVDQLSAHFPLEVESARLGTAVFAVRKARSDVDEHDSLYAVDPSRKSLVQLFADALHAKGCRPQRYWLVGSLYDVLLDLND
jgi:hypothetical protein